MEPTRVPIIDFIICTPLSLFMRPNSQTTTNGFYLKVSCHIVHAALHQRHAHFMLGTVVLKSHKMLATVLSPLVGCQILLGVVVFYKSWEETGCRPLWYKAVHLRASNITWPPLSCGPEIYTIPSPPPLVYFPQFSAALCVVHILCWRFWAAIPLRISLYYCTDLRKWGLQRWTYNKDIKTSL